MISSAIETGRLKRRGPALPGVDIDDSVARFKVWLVRMTAEHHGHTGCDRIDVDFRQIMQDINGNQTGK